MTDHKNTTLCPVPWMHLAFEPSGKVVPCCMTSVHDYFAGDLTTESIEEIWNSDNMKKLRVQMLNNEEPSICDKCFKRERVTGESSRIYHIRDFPEVVEQAPRMTLKDGTATKMELKYWDFRFSNLCNLKCRTCGPRYSSAWVPDAIKLGHEQEKVWNIDGVDDKTNFDFLKEQIHYVERIYFAGGEPLLMPEHWQTLDMLVENRRFDVKLSYNTNCSTLTYGKKNVIDYWSQWDFGKLEVWPSIDEIDDRAELVRSGTVWSKVQDNMIELSKLDNAIIRPGITVSAMNVFRIPEIVERLVEIGVVKPRFHHANFFINLVEHPSYYHVTALPNTLKSKTIKKITEFVENYNKKYNTNISPLFEYILHELTKPHESSSGKMMLKNSFYVDRVRNEKIFTTIPELQELHDMYPEAYRE
jgi:radical SAM protein with 4Fe4S-binding SPASM domain